MTGSNGGADEPRGLLNGIASDAVRGRGWKAFAGPAAFLLAATIAVVVVRSVRHADRPSSPAPRGSTVVSKHPVAPAPRSYTVQAGDTVAAIAAKTGVPVVRIRALNPRLQPTALFIGEKIRLK